jgi:hypothetical protein
MTNDGKVHAKPRQARTMTYRHDGDKYEATVGEPRKAYRRRTGPRGGYIKNADWQGWGTPTGSTVTAIIDAGHVIEVYSEEPSRGWANPSMVGHSEVMSIEWISEPGEQANPA